MSPQVFKFPVLRCLSLSVGVALLVGNTSAMASLPFGQMLSQAVQDGTVFYGIDTQDYSQQVGQMLVQAVQDGQMTFTNPNREGQQIQQLAESGVITVSGNTVEIDNELLTMLQALTSNTPATPENPEFSILSLVRYKQGPHGQVVSPERAVCKAVDINRYGGHQIDMRNPTEALTGVVAIIKALPPGSYALGLPRAPRLDPEGGAN